MSMPTAAVDFCRLQFLLLVNAFLGDSFSTSLLKFNQPFYLKTDNLLVLLLINVTAKLPKIKEPRISCYSKLVFFFPQQLLHMVTELTKEADIFHFEKLYAAICQCIYQHREDHNKTELLKVIFVL